MANGSTRRAGAAKKATKRRSAAKKAPTRRSAAARKGAAKKATATKRAPAKKAAPKRAAAKKAAPKKAASKRAAARKAAPKKVAARKAAPAKKAAPARKAPAKRATAIRPAAAAPSASAVVVDQSPTPASTPAVAATPETAAVAPAPVRTSTRGPGQRSLAFRVAGTVLVVAALALLIKMNAQERGGPTHEFVSIGDGIPATLYVPYDDDEGGLPVPPPADERVPVIVMAHGYSADRALMSGLARSFTEAGYAVLSFDFRGHGGNTHRFQGDLRDDFAAAVDYAETSPYVDGDNIAVLGHSMAAGAALDFATLDARPKAVIPLSGTGIVNDGVVPANTLFIVASGDPGIIGDQQDELAAQLRDRGGNVEQVEVGGSDHVTVLRKDKTVASVTTFLDPILGVERAAGDTPGVDDPRMKTAGLYLLVALALIAMLGSLVGRVAPAGPAADQPGPYLSGVALVGGALLVTMPVLAQGQWDLLPLGAGEPIVMHLGLAGALLWALRALARRGVVTGPVGRWLDSDRPWLSLRTGGWTGLAAAGVVVAMLLPLGPVFHRMVPTPQRALYWVVMAAVALPFFAAFHALIRRGTGAMTVVSGVIGRVLLLVLLVLGVAIGVLPFVILLVLPLLILQYIVLELFAATCYLASRNITVVALVDAIIVGWLTVTFTPVG
jgi:dienelactone hydrolase